MQSSSGDGVGKVIERATELLLSAKQLFVYIKAFQQDHNI